jgi:lipid II isoglutaminyl synthase (glutamine-hydrolysing)
VARLSAATPRQARLPPRAVAAVVAGKLLGRASRRLGRGGGTALPGVVAERIDPSLTARLTRQLGAGRIIVTGTNGKTTTARMLAGIAEAAGTRPVHNRSGSNLMRGIGTALLEAAGPDGVIADGAARAGVFEIDEATLPYAVPALRPNAVVFTNLFRDQLDRYGEVDSILALWRASLAALSPAATIVLNADDPSVAGLADAFAGRVLYFGIEAGAFAAPAGSAEHASDARWCHACGAEYVYNPIYFGHVGVWRCPGCGRRRPEPQVRVTSVREQAGDGLALSIATPGGAVDVDVPLEGLYNAYNAAAAFAGAQALGLATPAIIAGLSSFAAAFGRQERVRVDGRDVRMLLVKNPAGANQALQTVLAGPGPLHLLLALNDGVQDGRDISWIWDVDFEGLAGRVASIVTTGRRASDMALRLKYAGLGVDPAQVKSERDQAKALELALANTPLGQRLYVLPTYTAMMSLRAMIAARGGSSAFWEQ